MNSFVEIFLFGFFLWSSFVFIHEFGHALTARLLGIKIKKIELRIFSQSYVETEIINDAGIRKIILGFSGGFFACLFLLVSLIIFQFKTPITLLSFQLNLTDIGVCICIIHLVGGVIEGIFNELYVRAHALAQIYGIIISLILFYFYFLRY